LFAEKIGIFDNLGFHYGAICDYYTAKKPWSKHNPSMPPEEIEYYVQRQKESSESFREQGNSFFMDKDFSQAVQMYTQSIAAVIEGPLASMAYFNRLSPICYTLVTLLNPKGAERPQKPLLSKTLLNLSRK
jgi:hypothetical protein